MKEILKKMVFTGIEKRVLFDSVILITALLLFTLAWPAAVLISATVVASLKYVL